MSFQFSVNKAYGETTISTKHPTPLLPLTCHADRHELRPIVPAGGILARIRVAVLEISGHDALLGGEEICVSASRVSHGALLHVIRQQISEDPADSAEAEGGRQLLDQFLTLIRKKTKEVTGALLRRLVYCYYRCSNTWKKRNSILKEVILLFKCILIVSQLIDKYHVLLRSMKFRTWVVELLRFFVN